MTTNSNWLITGGTGSFGRALTKRVLANNLTDRLVIFSRDEKKQQTMRAEFDDPRVRFILGDVRDLAQLKLALQGIDVAFHAAALKQIDRSALDVVEFIKTNVLGTMNLIDACHANEVKRAIVLSTDKACASCTPYGATKALAEWLAISANVYGPTRISATRYGNVVGSRGSVLELWQRQYDAGELLTITQEQMTRFWMTIDDAVDLALLALARGRGGEVFIPRGIRRGRVLDFAQEHFPNAAGWRYVGKRAYEKTHEMLIAPEEADRVRDCGDVFVLLPHPSLVRWEPVPYGMLPGEGAPAGADFQYRSDR